MAHLRDILIDANNILGKVLEIHRKKEDNLLNVYFAARTIQRYYRGHLIRKHLKMIHGKAVMIQKHWRGFLGRRMYYERLEEKVVEKCKERFKLSAIKIQKVWRGYLARKNVFDYYLFKAWKEYLKRANENILLEIKKDKKVSEEADSLALEEEAHKTLQCTLLKSHYLLRTYHRKGVLSRKEDTKEYSPTEEILKSFNFMSYMKKQKQEQLKKGMERKNNEEIATDTEFTFEKIKKLKRDCAVKREKERLEMENRKKKELKIQKSYRK